MARTKNLKLTGRAGSTELRDRLRDATTPTPRSEALFEIKSLYGGDVVSYYNWFNTHYDSTKKLGNIEAYDKGILDKLSDMRLQKEVADEIQSDLEWLSSDTSDDNTLLPTGIIPNSVCPNCGNPLRINNKKNYLTITDRPRQFVGCTDFPKCTYIAQRITKEVRAKMQAVQVNLDNQEPTF